MTSPTQEASEAAMPSNLEQEAERECEKYGEIGQAAFLAGAQWQLTNLAEKGVEGARKVYVEICGGHECYKENYKRYCGEQEFKPLSQADEVVGFIEALPVLAKINQLQEQVEKDKQEIEMLKEDQKNSIRDYLELRDIADDEIKKNVDLERKLSHGAKIAETAKFNVLYRKEKSDNLILTSRVQKLEEALKDAIETIEATGRAETTSLRPLYLDKVRVLSQALAKGSI